MSIKTKRESNLADLTPAHSSNTVVAVERQVTVIVIRSFQESPCGDSFPEPGSVP